MSQTEANKIRQLRDSALSLQHQHRHPIRSDSGKLTILCRSSALIPNELFTSVQCLIYTITKTKTKSVIAKDILRGTYMKFYVYASARQHRAQIYRLVQVRHTFFKSFVYFVLWKPSNRFPVKPFPVCLNDIF